MVAIEAEAPLVKVAKVVAAFAVVLVLAFGAIGCSSGPGPSQAVDNLTAAINNKDLDAIVDCMDSSSAAAVGTAMKAGNTVAGLMGVETTDVYDQLLKELLSSSSEVSSALENVSFDQIAFTVGQVNEEVSGKSGHVSGNWTVEIPINGEVQSYEVPINFDCVKEDDGWKIDMTGVLKGFSDAAASVLEGLF